MSTSLPTLTPPNQPGLIANDSRPPVATATEATPKFSSGHESVSIRRSYLGLDVIRLFAALLVAFYHLGFWWWLPVKGDYSFHGGLLWLAPFVSSGWVGVPVFFVISGFVIAFSAERKNAAQFVRGRASRLYPAAWICASITLLVASPPVMGYLRSLALWPVGPWVSGVYWTLAVEIVFYSTVAVTMAAGGSLTRLALRLGLYSTAFWGIKLVNRLSHGPLDPVFQAIENERGYLFLAHDGVFFALGMVFWQFSRGEKPYALASLFTCVGMFAVLVRSYALAIDAAPFFVAGLLWLLVTVGIFASVKWNDQLWSRLGRWKNSIRTMGLMTYPLYLIHAELGRAVMLRFQSPVVALIAGMIVVLLASRAIVPLEERLRRLIWGLPQTSATSAP